MMSINEVQKAIADAISNGVSKEDLKSLEVKFMEMLDQRNGDQKDVESLFSKFQSDMETKLASLQTSQAKAGFIGVQKKESFGDFLVKVRNGDAELKAFTRKNLVENCYCFNGSIAFRCIQSNNCIRRRCGILDR